MMEKSNEYQVKDNDAVIITWLVHPPLSTCTISVLSPPPSDLITITDASKAVHTAKATEMVHVLSGGCINQVIMTAPLSLTWYSLLFFWQLRLYAYMPHIRSLKMASHTGLWKALNHHETHLWHFIQETKVMFFYSNIIIICIMFVQNWSHFLSAFTALSMQKKKERWTKCVGSSCQNHCIASESRHCSRL